MPSLDLLNEISQQLSLYKDQSESTEEWHGRVLYSALGKLSLASLWDSPDDWNHELSVQAFKSKIKTNTEYYQQIVNSNCLYTVKKDGLMSSHSLHALTVKNVWATQSLLLSLPVAICLSST